MRLWIYMDTSTTRLALSKVTSNSLALYKHLCQPSRCEHCRRYWCPDEAHERTQENAQDETHLVEEGRQDIRWAHDAIWGAPRINQGRGRRRRWAGVHGDETSLGAGSSGSK